MKLNIERHNNIRLRLKRGTWYSVAFMLFLIAVICTTGRFAKLSELSELRASAIQDKFVVMAAESEQTAAENELLKDKLARSATYQTPEAVKTVSRYYIEKYFGKEADAVEKVMTCESGLDNRRDHTNKDGSLDMGLYQIHDEPAHRNNIKKMYGVDIAIGAHDFDISSRYAKFLWDRSPSNWVCYQLINKK